MDLTAHPMVPEQRTKPGRTHRLAALLAFQANEKVSEGLALDG